MLLSLILLCIFHFLHWTIIELFDCNIEIAIKHSRTFRAGYYQPTVISHRREDKNINILKRHATNEFTILFFLFSLETNEKFSGVLGFCFKSKLRFDSFETSLLKYNFDTFNFNFHTIFARL